MTLSKGAYELALTAFHYGHTLGESGKTFKEAKKEFDKTLKRKKNE